MRAYQPSSSILSAISSKPAVAFFPKQMSKGILDPKCLSETCFVIWVMSIEKNEPSRSMLTSRGFFLQDQSSNLQDQSLRNSSLASMHVQMCLDNPFQPARGEFWVQTCLASVRMQVNLQNQKVMMQVESASVGGRSLCFASVCVFVVVCSFLPRKISQALSRAKHYAAMLSCFISALLWSLPVHSRTYITLSSKWQPQRRTCSYTYLSIFFGQRKRLETPLQMFALLWHRLHQSGG